MYKSKKVFIVTNLLTPYRVEFFNQINALLENDQLILIFLERKSRRHNWEIKENDGLISYYPQNKIFYFLKVLFNILKANKRDKIVISGFNIISILIFTCAKIKRVKVIQWTEERMRPKSTIRFIIRKYLLPKFNKIISVSTKSYEYHINTFNISKNKIAMVLQTAILKLNPLIKPKLPNSIDFLYVGKLDEYKNVPFLVDTFIKFVRKAGYNTKLNIVGDGKHFEKISNIVNQQNLSDKIILHGYIKDRKLLNELYADSDVFIISSIETFGVVLAEAASFALPIISSDEVGASFDIIDHETNGYIYQHNNQFELLMYINKICQLDNYNKIKTNCINRPIVSYNNLAKQFLKAIS